MNIAVNGKHRTPFIILIIFFGLLLFSIVIGAGIGIQNNNQDDCSGNNSPVSIGNLNGNTTTANMVQNEKIVWNYLKSQGWSNAGASALLGRIMQESRFDPNAFDGVDSHGIAQWRLQRWNDAQNWMKAHGHDPNSIQGQIMYEVYEMQTKYSSVYNAVVHAPNTSNGVHDAEMQITRHYEVGTLGNALQYAQGFFASFGKGNDKTTVAGQSFPNVNTKGADTCNLANFGGGGSITKVAQQMLGYFTYAEVRPPQVAKNGNDNSIKSVADVNKNGRCDCSGFVWLVLKICGYKVPKECWYTGSMQADARGSHHWLKAIPSSQAKAGDVVIVNDGSGSGGNGHTAILLENWHGNSTKIINMGGIVGRHGVNIATFQQSFLSLLNGGTITFAQPLK